MGKKFDRIYIELSNICNFSCPFCSGVNREKREMSIDEVISTLSQVGEFTNEVCLHVLGEPLLYSKFSEVLDICQVNNLKINLVTNGYFIIDKLDVILQNAILFKKVSFSVHSYVYHQEDIFCKLSNIMKASILLSNKGVSIEIRNLNGNDEQVFADNIKLAIANSTGVELCDINHNQKIKDKLFYVVKKPFLWPDQTKNSEVSHGSKGRLFCLGGKTHIAILSNLTVVPCCLDSAGEIRLGSLQEQTLGDILLSSIYTDLCKAFNNGRAKYQLCSTCKYSQ